MTNPHIPTVLSKDLEEAISIEDFKSCRELLVENIKIMEKNETFVVGAVGAIIAFGINQTNPTIFTVHLFLIPIIVALGFLRFWALRHVIRLADSYTRKVEALIPLKWASYYKAETTGVLGWSRYAFWVVLVILAVFYVGLGVGSGPFSVATSLHLMHGTK